MNSHLIIFICYTNMNVFMEFHDWPT